MLAKKCPTCGELLHPTKNRCYKCKPGRRHGSGASQENGVRHDATKERPESNSGRKSRVYWNAEEKQKLIDTALMIRDQTGLTRWKKLIYRAQQAVLPPERHRDLTFASSESSAWFCDPVLNAPPLRAVRPAQSSAPVPEPTPPVLWPPAWLKEPCAAEPPTQVYDESPLPHPLSVETLLDEVTTGDLVAILAKRLYEEMGEGFRTIGKAVFDLERRQRRDHILLRRIASDLGITTPKREAPAIEDELFKQTGFATPEPLRVPAQSSAPAPPSNGSVAAKPVPPKPPKLKVAVVGLMRDQINRLMKEAAGVADITCFALPEDAVRRGFRKFDRVILSRYSSHVAREKAINDVGRANVVNEPTINASTIAERIRRMAGPG